MVSRTLLALAVLFVSAACGCETVDPRQGVLEDMAQRVILPTLATFSDRSTALERSIDALCQEPTDDGLKAAQAAWRAARQAYKQGEAFAFGPVVTDRLGSSIDFWPVRTEKIEEAPGRSEPLTEDEVDAGGATVQGLPVIEYVLFGGGAGPEPTLDWLAKDDRRRCRDALALGLHLKTRATKLLDAWAPGHGDYARAFERAGHGSVSYESSIEAVSAVVNQLVVLVESIANKKLGVPFGLKSGGTAVPSAVESPYAVGAVADMQANLAGLRQLYGATSEAAQAYARTLKDYIKRRNPEVDESVMDALRALEQSLGEIGDSLATALSEKPAAVSAALDRARELKRVIAVDLASQLSATVTFSDNDGD